MSREVLTRLSKLEAFARRALAGAQEQEDFISYCSLEFFSGRSPKTPAYWLLCDYLRRTLRQVKNSPVRVWDTKGIPEPRTDDTEDDVIRRIDQRKIVSDIVRKLKLDERLIISMYFFDELSLKDVAEIFGVTEGRMSVRVNTLLGKIRKSLDGVAEISSAV